MRFALLGDHSEALRVARAVGQLPDQQLCAAVEIGTSAAADLMNAAPGVQLLRDWEEVVTSEGSDAALIGGASEVVLNGARQLASNEKPLFFIPIAAQGSAFIYELTLIHDDNRVPLVPVVPLVSQALVERLKSAIAAESLGRLVLLRLERGVIADRAGGLLSRELIHAELLHDVLLLRSIAGGYSRITAVHSGASDAGVTMATVTLGGEGLPEASWVARGGEPVWNLIATGTDGEATLSLDRSSLAGQLVLKPKNSPVETITDDGQSAGRRALELALQQQDRAPDRWIEMTRGFETVEATATSLRRRRTIDMHFETTSERSIFKSQMAAGGCSLLLLTLGGLIAFLLLGAFLDSRSMLQRSAESTGRVIPTTEFEASDSNLNRIGKQHVTELARRLERSPEPIFVMPESSGDVTELDRQRVATVVQELRAIGHQHAEALVDHAKLPSFAVQLLLRVLRVAWIAPLIVFLALQALLFVARPSSHQDNESDEQRT